MLYRRSPHATATPHENVPFGIIVEWAEGQWGFLKEISAQDSALLQAYTTSNSILLLSRLYHHESGALV